MFVLKAQNYHFSFLFLTQTSCRFFPIWNFDIAFCAVFVSLFIDLFRHTSSPPSNTFLLSPFLCIILIISKVLHDSQYEIKHFSYSFNLLFWLMLFLANNAKKFIRKIALWVIISEVKSAKSKYQNEVKHFHFDFKSLGFARII